MTSSDRTTQARSGHAPRAQDVVTPCFTAGTLIKTIRGEVPVETLGPGDLVLTRDRGYQPVRWSGRRHLTSSEMSYAPDLRPIRIAAGALGQNLPMRDMRVSPQHRMMISNARTQLWFGEDEVLAAAVHLTIFEGIEQDEMPDGVTYFHFLFDRHELVVADGAWAESFQPGDLSLGGLGVHQRKEILAIFPELETEDGEGAYQSARVSLTAEGVRILAGR